MSTGLASLDREPDDTVGRILAAAEGCFRRAGYAGASMREIALAAGVSKSLLHHHFESKEQLFVRVQVEVYRRLAAHVTTAVSALPRGADRGLEALELLFSALRETNDLSMHAELLARSIGNADVRAHMMRLRAHLKTLLRDTLERLLGPDQSLLELPIDTTTEVLWAALTGLALQAALGENAARVERALDGIRRIAALVLGISSKERNP